jgi:hypothetical protein
MLPNQTASRFQPQKRRPNLAISLILSGSEHSETGSKNPRRLFPVKGGEKLPFNLPRYQQ